MILYRSNGGRGPLIARVVAAKGDVVIMERRHQTGKKWTRFTLPRAYLDSPRCGWKRALDLLLGKE